MSLKHLEDLPPWEWPPDAGKSFHEALADRGADPTNRLMAAELAGDLVVMNEQLAEDLIGIVSSAEEPPELRAQAAIALGPVLDQTDTDGFDDPFMGMDGPPISEDMFRKIKDTLQTVYSDETQPKLLRRRILEAAVRAPEDWQRKAIPAAYSSGDREWMLTAVFGMRYVRGFDEQILEALKNADPEIHCEAVEAAGVWELEGAWPHVVELINDPNTPKDLLIAAIGATNIRRDEAEELLEHLIESDDEDIAEAVQEAISMADIDWDEDDDEEDDDEDFN